MYTAMNEGDLRIGEWNNRREWNMEVGRRHQTFKTAQYIYIYTYIYIIKVFVVFRLIIIIFTDVCKERTYQKTDEN